MTKILPVVIFAMLMAIMSDNRSKYELDEYGIKRYISKEKFFYFVMAVVMAAFVGLRTSGNDTGVYRYGYESTLSGVRGFNSINWKNISGAPGLAFVRVILRTIGATYQDYFMVTGFFVTCTYLWFIKKHTCNIKLSVFMFITMGGYTFAMAAIKQTMAVAFLLIATDNAIQKKWGRFLFWVIIGELFHPYAFIYLVVPFLTFSPWSNKSYLLIMGTIVIAFSLRTLLGAIDDVTSALGYDYSVDSFTGSGVNIFRVLVVWVPVVISYFGRSDLQKSTNHEMNIIVNLTMMNALIMFIGLFGTANYFARLANYFVIFQTLSVPWLLRYISLNNKSLVTTAAYIGYAGFFTYEMLIHGTFDGNYSFITIQQYLSHFF